MRVKKESRHQLKAREVKGPSIVARNRQLLKISKTLQCLRPAIVQCQEVLQQCFQSILAQHFKEVSHKGVHVQCRQLYDVFGSSRLVGCAALRIARRTDHSISNIGRRIGGAHG